MSKVAALGKLLLYAAGYALGGMLAAGVFCLLAVALVGLMMLAEYLVTSVGLSPGWQFAVSLALILGLAGAGVGVQRWLEDENQ